MTNSMPVSRTPHATILFHQPILFRKVIVMATNHPVDLALVEAYLHNLQLALLNDQPQTCRASVSPCPTTDDSYASQTIINAATHLSPHPALGGCWA